MRTSNYRLVGPFQAASGTVASQAEVTVTVNHKLQRQPIFAVGHLEDGSFSHGFGWRAVMGLNTVQIVFRNNMASGSGGAILKFMLAIPE